MKRNEINAIVKKYEKAVEAEKAAKKEQRLLQDQLRKELFALKPILIEFGPIMFSKPIEYIDTYGQCSVIGLRFDDSHKFYFPEGRVRMMAAEDGKYEKDLLPPENVNLMAEVLLIATQTIDKMTTKRSA